ncbi:MAG: WD40 repeat domain-containing protein, partial [Solirubrobacteraceae bacterium]
LRTGPSRVGLFSATTDVELASLMVSPRTSVVTALAFSPDGRNLAVAGRSGLVRLWSAATGEAPRLLRAFRGLSQQYGQPEAVQTVAISPDGHDLAAVDAQLQMTGKSSASTSPRPRVVRP